MEAPRQCVEGVESSEAFFSKLLSPVRGPTGRKRNDSRFFFEGTGFVGFCRLRSIYLLPFGHGGFRRQKTDVLSRLSGPFDRPWLIRRERSCRLPCCDWLACVGLTVHKKNRGICYLGVPLRSGCSWMSQEWEIFERPRVGAAAASKLVNE